MTHLFGPVTYSSDHPSSGKEIFAATEGTSDSDLSGGFKYSSSSSSEWSKNV